MISGFAQYRQAPWQHTRGEDQNFSARSRRASSRRGRPPRQPTRHGRLCSAPSEVARKRSLQKRVTAPPRATSRLPPANWRNLGMAFFFGVYRASVTDTDDPLGQSRVQVRVPAVSAGTTLWAAACLPSLAESSSIADLPLGSTPGWRLRQGIRSAPSTWACCQAEFARQCSDGLGCGCCPMAPAAPSPGPEP
jgi:hypothetical protein